MIRTLCLTLILTGVAASQTATLALATPAVAQVTLNGQTLTTTLPAGPLGDSGSTGQSQGGSHVNVEWRSFVNPTSTLFTLQSTTFCEPGANASLSGGDFVYQLSNPTPVIAELFLRRTGSLNNVTLLVDVGNDGSVELTSTSPAEFVTLQVTLGPTPLPIRILNDVTMPSASQQFSSIVIIAAPIANIVTSRAAIGCDTTHEQVASTMFSGDLLLGVQGLPFATQPSVMVLGLSLQPVLLPTTGSFPCLLLPSPDVTLFPGSQFVTLHVPASVQPYAFWVQSVVLHPTELRTTDAVYVQGF